jgi:hypothetical protein
VTLLGVVAGVPAAALSTGDPWPALRRPLHIPHLGPGSRCPVSKSHTISGDFGPGLGPGPVYPILEGRLLFNYPPTPDQLWYPTKWSGQKALWVAKASYRGPALIRGRRLDGPHELRFGGGHVPERELRLTGSKAFTTGWSGRQWPSYTRLRAAGCYAWQVDGTTFSRVIVFRPVRVS